MEKFNAHGRDRDVIPNVDSKSVFGDLKLFFFVPIPYAHLKNFFKNEVQLIYNVALISAIQQSDSVIHLYIFFFIFFSIVIYHGILIQFFVLYNRALLFIHPIYNSLYLLTSISHSNPPPPPSPLGNHKSVPYDCESVSILQIGSFVSYFRFHI